VYVCIVQLRHFYRDFSAYTANGVILRYTLIVHLLIYVVRSRFNRSINSFSFLFLFTESINSMSSLIYSIKSNSLHIDANI